jgi:predicted RND superfamily exporter protein
VSEREPEEHASLRARIEAGFEQYGHRIIRWRWAVLLASLAVGVAFGSGVRSLSADVSFESFLHEDDPIRIDYDVFRDRFGREDAIVVAIGGEDVFDRAFLDRLHAFHEAALELPHVDDVTSLINARDTRGEGDTLLVNDLLEDWPLDDDALRVARERALANPLYHYNLISPDARFTSVRIDLDTYSSVGREEVDVLAGFEESAASEATFLTTAETDAFAASINRLVDEHRAPGFDPHAAGLSVMLYNVSQALLRDMRRFVGFAAATIALLLFAIFRRSAGVVLPLVVVGLSVSSTMGLMGHLGTPIHLPTQILPSMLLAIGVADAVHILAIFFRLLRQGRSQQDALAGSLGHSAWPVVLTSLTTAGGFVSFAWTDLAPVSALGFYAPMGVLFALFYSLTLLPALLAILPIRAGEVRADGADGLERVLTAAGDFAAGRPRSVLAVTAALCVLAAAGLPRIEVSHDPPKWLPAEDPARRAIELVDAEMGGAMTVEVLVESSAEGGIRSPRLLDEMGRFGELLESEPLDGLSAGQTYSLADIVKEIHRALNEGLDSHYVVPDDPALIAQELLLFESSGSDDLEDRVDTAYSVGRISVRLPWYDGIRYVSYLDAVDERAAEMLGSAARVEVAGNLPIIMRTVRAVVFGVFESYGIALLIIVPLMALLLGSVRMGLYAMVPNLVPLLMTLGFMAWFDVPFDAFTMMTGGIALGLVVDDTIHFMHNFARYHARHGDVGRAIHDTLSSVGRAITITSVVLGTGFLIFIVSSMNNLVAFGQVLAFAVTAALVADVLVAPALMTLVMPDSAAGSDETAARSEMTSAG